MKYLISGGSSFIGVALTEYLLSQGHEVFVVCRYSSATNNLPIDNNVHIINYNGLDDIESVNSKINSIDVWIHLAWGGTGHEGRNNIERQNNNIKYSLKAVDVAKSLGAKVFVDAGSQAEYGYVSGILTENTACHPENEYGKAKLKFGELCKEKCSQYSIKHIHLRILSVFGETDHEWTLPMNCVRKMLKNEPIELSSCEQKWNFVYVKDAAKQICLLIENALNNSDFESEIYNIASSDTRVLKCFIEEMAELTNTNSKLLYGYYKPQNIVSLDPCIDKLLKGTNGFVSDYSFKDVINKIITHYNSYNI